MWSCRISNLSWVFKIKRILGNSYVFGCYIYTKPQILSCLHVFLHMGMNINHVQFCIKYQWNLFMWVLPIINIIIFNLFFPRKENWLAIYDQSSQWLQIFQLSKKSFAFEIKTIKRFWHVWHSSVTQFFIFFFLKTKPTI